MPGSQHGAILSLVMRVTDMGVFHSFFVFVVLVLVHLLLPFPALIPSAEPREDLLNLLP